MNRDEVIRMAREANFYESEIGGNEDCFVRFFHAAYAAGAAAEQAKCKGFASMLAQATVLAEREKCAQLVETYEKSANTMGALEFVMVFKDCAAAIRARGETK